MLVSDKFIGTDGRSELTVLILVLVDVGLGLVTSADVARECKS